MEKRLFVAVLVAVPDPDPNAFVAQALAMMVSRRREYLAGRVGRGADAESGRPGARAALREMAFQPPR